MTPREKGFLLLTSSLGNPGRRVLTDAQLRTLARRSLLLKVDDPERDLVCEDLMQVGYCKEDAIRILSLLQQQDELSWYVREGEKQGCYPVTRVSSAYPQRLRTKLALDCPGCLWLKGDPKLLLMPSVGLVGCRELRGENAEFAREVGRQAAVQGYALVSGNARGADREAQNACLEAGGYVISVVAEPIKDQVHHPRILYIAEGGFDLAFTPQRALHRNITVHCLADKMFVAQSNHKKGGTWNGTAHNLRGKYSPVFSFADGSDAHKALVTLGATAVEAEDLKDISSLEGEQSLFNK